MIFDLAKAKDIIDERSLSDQSDLNQLAFEILPAAIARIQELENTLVEERAHKIDPGAFPGKVFYEDDEVALVRAQSDAKDAAREQLHTEGLL